MKVEWAILDEAEKVTFVLRSLYRKYGFRRYKMSKFEDYDLYGRNKEFLVSENLITFTDMKGKLKALKPDVTLSIIKNHRDPEEGVFKLCYDENVYRASGKSGDFREILQSGLECFGKVDAACIGEVLEIALRALALLERKYVLSVSNLDLVSGYLKELTEDPVLSEALLKAVGAKNAHEIDEIVASNGLCEAKAARLKALAALCGPVSEVLPKLEELTAGTGFSAQVEEMKRIFAAIDPACLPALELDFSVVGNTTYYNGLIFKGFVEGVPESVISGGQYDGLMKKLGRKPRAVGFAVYLDAVERLEAPERTEETP